MSLRILRVPVVLGIAGLMVSACERPPAQVIQRGYRGLAMEQVYNPRTVAGKEAANVVPTALPLADPEGPPASSVYHNIQVLTDLNVAQLTRLMVAITAWVAPADQSCAYCHSGADMANDDNYRKVVARQMLRMVRTLNTQWKPHVGETGVTCYTCHRGNGVPSFVWYHDPGPAHMFPNAGNRAGQNAPAPSVGLTALPNDPFSEFLDDKATNIRVVATTALPGDKGWIKQAEETYGLMMHMSEALGVNCTFCHNTRSFMSWDSSTPQRATAWYGIRMVRDLNAHYLEPVTSIFPDNRKGPMGDVAKVNCETCHQGVYKPLFGKGMLKDYPELAGPMHPAVAPSADAK
ncbi:MAG TPA: photosynthetic reaction center cytochrome PufC [Steroidobacteraceae bacterium]